jgi:uncharacterized protein YndB with AHSA1/START domain
MPPLKTRGFAHRIDITVEPPKVWAVLCGPALLPVWAGVGARIKPQKGGHWTIVPTPGLVREAMIDIFDVPRRLRLIYMTPPDLPVFDGAVVEDILLDTEGPNTVVRMLCSGVPDFAAWTPYFGKVRMHSERALARLKVLCEQRERMAQASSRGPA